MFCFCFVKLFHVCLFALFFFISWLVFFQQRRSPPVCLRACLYITSIFSPFLSQIIILSVSLVFIRVHRRLHIAYQKVISHDHANNCPQYMQHRFFNVQLLRYSKLSLCFLWFLVHDCFSFLRHVLKAILVRSTIANQRSPPQFSFCLSLFVCSSCLHHIRHSEPQRTKPQTQLIFETGECLRRNCSWTVCSVTMCTLLLCTDSHLP